MVTGLPLINIPTENCEEFLQENQHNGKFNKDACCRTKDHLEVVYLIVYESMQVDSNGGNIYFIVERYGHT